MVEVIENFQYVTGLVIEKDTDSRYALVRYKYEKDTKQYKPTILLTFSVDMIMEGIIFNAAQDKEDEKSLREVLKGYVGRSKIYVRKPDIISLSELEED